MLVYVVGHAPARAGIGDGGFDWFSKEDYAAAVAAMRSNLDRLGGTTHSLTFVPLEVPDDVAYKMGERSRDGMVVDRVAVTNWIDANLPLVEVGLPRADGERDGEDARAAAGQAPPLQTRPSAVLRRPDPEAAVSEATTAELLFEALERARDARATEQGLSGMARDAAAIARELSICVTLIEDAITRHNKAVYLQRGVFAITDAERLPAPAGDAEAAEQPPQVVSRTARGVVLAGRRPVAVVAANLQEAREELERSSPGGTERLEESGYLIVTKADEARGAQFSDVLYVPGWDRLLDGQARESLVVTLEATLRG